MKLFTLLIILLWHFSSFASQTDCARQLLKIYTQDLQMPFQVAESLDRNSLFSQIYTPLFSNLPLTELDKRNMSVIESLKKYSAMLNEDSRPKGANKTFANYLQREILKVKSIYNHTQTGSCPYDPKGTVGFCFGVAHAAYSKIMKLGAPKKFMLKLWLVGPFDHGRWNHHVVLLFKSQNNSWWVFDPTNYNEPIDLLDYYNSAKNNESVQGKVLLIPSDPQRLLSSPTRYGSSANHENMNQEFLSLEIDWSGFFRDSQLDHFE